MKKLEKVILGAVIATTMISVGVYAASGSKEIKTGTVTGSLYGNSGYANAKTAFAANAGYTSEKAYVFIESVHSNGATIDSEEAYGTNYDKYNAWTSLRDNRASKWHSAHSSTGTDQSMYLWITD